MTSIIRKNFLRVLGYLSGMVCLCVFFASSAAASVSSIMIDAQTGEVLSSSSADYRRYPASLTKIMTLYITFDALEKGLLKPDDELPVSRNAANRSPSKLGVRAGQKVSVKTCIMAVIVKSANDCATVLAEGLGYTEENFAKTMTKVARELGMKNTIFKNASGLPNRQQKTTARDMALLAAAMYHHFPQYYKLFSAKKFSYNGRTYYTHNHILKNFEGADGMKTGFTNAAGYNIVTSAERDGRRVIAVTMGHNTAKTRDRHVIRMMDSGLKKLALNDKVKNANIYAEIENKNMTADEPKTLTAENTGEAANVWEIQVGAFSNYTKARNYALQIKKSSRNIFADKNITIEPVETGAAIIYRSKLSGFDKDDADKACSRLKKSNKSCIVVAGTPDSRQLLLAHNRY